MYENRNDMSGQTSWQTGGYLVWIRVVFKLIHYFHGNTTVGPVTLGWAMGFQIWVFRSELWIHFVMMEPYCISVCRLWKELFSWWRHQMETFSALLAICAGNSPVSGEFPAQRPVTRSFNIFFDLRLNKRLSKQSWSWWFETLWCPLWRQCNVLHLCVSPKDCACMAADRMRLQKAVVLRDKDASWEHVIHPSRH